MLPKQFAFLESEPGPKMLLELLKIFGTVEKPGPGDNQTILAWAVEAGVKNYQHDSIAWCGLTMAIAAFRAGKLVPVEPLWAANWSKWGIKVKVAMLGDILCFSRPGGNHVAMYIGEDKFYYYVLGGNQGDQISITKIVKGRCWSISRPEYIVQPANVRRIYLSVAGPVSTNEA